MKIISWNCNMAFRKKYHKILKLNPDLLVLQECEHEEKITVGNKTIHKNQDLKITDMLRN